MKLEELYRTEHEGKTLVEFGTLTPLGDGVLLECSDVDNKNQNRDNKNQNRALFVEWYKRHTGEQLSTKGDCEVYSTFCQMAKTIFKKS